MSFRTFYLELFLFVLSGVVNTASHFGYIQKSPEEQAGLWMIFFCISGLILIHLWLALMEVQKQSRERRKLVLLLDDLFRQMKRESEDVQTRLINESIETMQRDPSAYENFLPLLNDGTKTMIKKCCGKHILCKQRRFGEDLIRHTGEEKTIPVYRSDVFLNRSKEIAAFEKISAACESA